VIIIDVFACMRLSLIDVVSVNVHSLQVITIIDFRQTRHGFRCQTNY